MAVRKIVFGCICYVLVASTPLFAAEAAEQEYGSDDRLGALHALTPELVRQASGLVKTGKVYSLAIETEPTASAGFKQYRAILAPIKIETANKITGFDDTVILAPGLGTTLDGLGHAGRDGRHYNGVRAEDIYDMTGAKVFGIETLPPIVARGVLLDFARHRGEAVVAAGTAIDRAEIEAMMKAEKVAIRRGDVVLLHTGWLDFTSKNAGPHAPGEPGLGEEGARFLAQLGVVAVGADTPGVEVDPAARRGEYAPVHQILIVDHGIYLFENIDTRTLAADRAYEFMFVAAAPRLRGTVQSNLHPIAIR